VGRLGRKVFENQRIKPTENSEEEVGKKDSIAWEEKRIPF